ncbi:unnamed protein product, partial [Polarella glacialis]
DVLRDLDAFGFPRDYAVRCLELNKHNHVTTTYYLLAEKKRRMMEKLGLAVPHNGSGTVNRVDPHAAFEALGDSHPPPTAAVGGRISPPRPSREGYTSPREAAAFAVSPRSAEQPPRGSGIPGAPLSSRSTQPTSARGDFSTRGEQPTSARGERMGARSPTQGGGGYA